MQNSAIKNNFPSFNHHFTDVNNRKQKHDSTTKEGVVVNTFIKDGYNWNPDVPMRQTPLPADMFEKKDKKEGKWYKNPVIPLIIAPLVVLGAGAGLAKTYKTSFIKKYGLAEKDRIPAQGRVISINKDDTMALLMLVKDPTWKNLQVAAAVIAASATGFIMKNVVDGFKEVWVKKCAADIKRDKEEKLISVETRAFSGKNQIIRNLTDKNARELNEYELSFKGTNKEAKKTDESKNWLYIAGGLAAIGASVLLTRSILKNISSVAKEVEKSATEAKKVLNKDIKQIKQRTALEKKLEKTKLSDKAKDYVRDEWKKLHDRSGFATTPEYMTGTLDKTGFTPYVAAEPSSFIYTWMINKNPQTKTLATVMCSAAGLGYIGQKAVEGVKEVQVEKANANTEVDLQDRLVQVELNNFYAKKTSYIAPIMEDTKEKIKLSKSKEETKKLKENALSEIKNGPPFVYS